MSNTAGDRPLALFDCPLEGINLIEASAGTGKTWNICGLYLRLLLESELEVQRILVVTFTHAATAELRDRIRQRLVDTLNWLRKPHEDRTDSLTGDPFVPMLVDSLRRRGAFEEPALIARLELALSSFDEAAILTIHGFCQRAIADTPFTAGMPFSTEALHDDGPMRLGVVNDFWRRHIATDGFDRTLAAWLLAKNDSPEKFAALLKRHIAKPTARTVWPDGLDAIVTGRIDLGELQAAHGAARDCWLHARDEVLAAVERALPILNKSSYKAASIARAAEDWDRFLREADAFGWVGARRSRKDDKANLLTAGTLEARLNAKRKPGDPEPPKHRFFTLSQHLLDVIDSIEDRLELARLRLLRELLGEAGRALRDAKRETRVVTFDDMLLNLHERLSDEEGGALAAALRAQYPAALIDEFQDTDPLQFRIFEAIYSAHPTHPLFLVGDPKQAIYSFRNADLPTYLDARSKAAARWTLDENQRSSADLLAALNHLFGRNPNAFMLDDLRYRPVKFGRKPREPLIDRSVEEELPSVPALRVWMLPHGAHKLDLLPKTVARTASARATAVEIARLLAAGVCGEVRIGIEPLRGGDIAVLVRSHADGALIRDALSAAGVDSVVHSKTSVLLGLDAEDLDRVLCAVLEPTRQRLLNAALATEAHGMDAASLARLASDEASLVAVVQRFVAYRELWLAHGVGRMLRRWLHAEGVTTRLLGRDDGARRLTNLLHLIELLQRAETTHPAPDALLGWLRSQRREALEDEETQLRLETDSNLVQIVTIHKSKGLEYPIVFCPFLWAAPRTGNDAMDGLEYHDDAGHAVIDWRNALPDALHDAADQAAIDSRRRLERDAESMRLIYVALTRAVYRCVIVAGCYRTGSDKLASDKEGRRSLTNWMVAGAGTSPDDWRDHEHDVIALAGAWQALADESGGTIRVEPLPRETVTDRPLVDRGGPVLEALDAPRRIPSGWWIGSYSALAWRATHERASADRDERAPIDGAGATSSSDPIDSLTSTRQLPTPVADDDILRFPRGAAAGECIHALFEHIDFTRPAAWPVAIDAALRRFPPGTGNQDEATFALQARMLARMADDVLATPIEVGTTSPLQLGSVSRNRRLTEIEFLLPCPSLGAGELNSGLARLGYPVPPLAFRRLQGFLRGFIDLVVEHEGRFFIVDWKSNHLGDQIADYDGATIAQAMHAHAYHLQYLLYSVALDRLLRRRLPDYRPEAHFGGALYLFVRSVRPGTIGHDGSAAGVFFDRPAPATIATLSDMLNAREALPQ